MKKIVLVLILAVVVVSIYLLFKNNNKSDALSQNENLAAGQVRADKSTLDKVLVKPISHASFVLTLDETVIYNDPVGSPNVFKNQPTPDIILISDIHGDHLSTSTLTAIVKAKTSIVAPQAVADRLPPELLAQTTILANNKTLVLNSISIEAIPMYNLPESEDSRHTKGRGNGYVLESEDVRVYIAGDTADIPEMRDLEKIDIAFIPMNLPFTMDVETAADAVLELSPTRVYPYHYRGQTGLSDVSKFKEIIDVQNPEIEVILHDWYPDSE